MSKHYTAYCATPGCCARLGTPPELDTGLCLACLQDDNEDPDRMATLQDVENAVREHDALYEDHEHCDPDRISAQIDAAMDRRGDMARIIMQQEDRYALEHYNLDAGLARDDERARGRRP